MTERLVFDHPEKRKRPEHNRLVLYTGIPGVGKDFLLDRLQQTDPRAQNTYRIFSFGEMLFQRITEQQERPGPAIDDRDMMRDVLSQEQVTEQVLFTADAIIAQQPGIINTHVVYRQQDSLVINPHIIRRLSPQSIVFLHADPEDIRRWRTNSPRKRDDSSVEELTFLQGVAYDVTRRLGEYVNAPVFPIENREGATESNIAELQAVVDTIVN